MEEVYKLDKDYAIDKYKIYYTVEENSCWKPYNRKPNFNGRYYQITRKVKGDKKVLAMHRYVYSLYNGEIDYGLVIRHTCDNDKCINPKHLITGTQKENMQDMVDRNRSTKGEKNGKSKLTVKEIKEIIDLYFDKKFNQTELGNLYKVSQRNISNIVNNKTWI